MVGKSKCVRNSVLKTSHGTNDHDKLQPPFMRRHRQLSSSESPEYDAVKSEKRGGRGGRGKSNVRDSANSLRHSPGSDATSPNPSSWTVNKPNSESSHANFVVWLPCGCDRHALT